jgi:hypothetical protein
MLKKMIVVAVLSAVSVLAVADEVDARNEAKQVIDLKDGSIAYVFDNGKMALESKFGNAVVVKPGTTLQTADGRSITMVGDEVARLDSLLQQGRHS